MGKDAIIQVPTAHLEIRGKKPEVQTQEATMHLVPVPKEALAEVQEVLKKYKHQMDRFNELLKKAIKDKEG